jgi:hypothetical protein
MTNPEAGCNVDSRTTRGTYLDLVLTALNASGRIPRQRPELGLPAYFNRDNLDSLYLEEHPGGWVANIAFRNVPPWAPDTVGTPDAFPFPSRDEAFIAGARIVCQIVTGSTELPFLAANGNLIAFGYRSP